MLKTQHRCSTAWLSAWRKEGTLIVATDGSFDYLAVRRLFGSPTTVNACLEHGFVKEQPVVGEGFFAKVDLSQPTQIRVGERSDLTAYPIIFS